MKFYYNVIRTGVPGMLDKNVLKTAGFEAGDKLEVNIEEGGTRIVITRVKEAFDAHKWARSIHKKYSADYYWTEIGGHRCIAYEKVTPIDRMTKFGLPSAIPMTCMMNMSAEQLRFVMPRVFHFLMNLHQAMYIKNKAGGEQSFTARPLDYNSLSFCEVNNRLPRNSLNSNLTIFLV